VPAADECHAVSSIPPPTLASAALAATTAPARMTFLPSFAYPLLGYHQMYRLVLLNKSAQCGEECVVITKNFLKFETTRHYGGAVTLKLLPKRNTLDLRK